MVFPSSRSDKIRTVLSGMHVGKVEGHRVVTLWRKKGTGATVRKAYLLPGERALGDIGTISGKAHKVTV
ncbi:hypothetical protein NDU88_001240 [Pleurodeles waltl]|uniref:Uncharacterized protein n=1 Tax=Pleurodeles waltl TaxID=8319 RepID=A0AAV7UWA4_PLEWA|nr:hypothetical protein NDU88_001240 [Pleurodeles waltl]